MNNTLRDEFDLLFEEVLEELPEYVRKQLEEIPVILEDEPSPRIREEMGEDLEEGPSDLCGLHSGIPLTERSFSQPSEGNSVILLFRGPIRRLASPGRSSLKREIRITLLHEIAHHFGFTEEQLEAMGYG